MCFEVVQVIFDNHDREYHPGEQLTCAIIVAPVCLWNFFKLNSISINVSCPYESTHVPYFQLSRLASYDTSTDERIRTSGRLDTEELIARDFVLSSGYNRFNVSFKIPHVSNGTFRTHNQLIRCKMEIVFNVRYMPPLPIFVVTDYFVISPSNIKETKEKLRNAALKFVKTL